MRCAAFAFCALPLFAAAARADEGVAAAPPPDPRGVYTFVTENDLYAAHNSDRHYSNGLRLGWLSADDDMPDWARRLGDLTRFLDPQGRRRIGWSLGHNLYTPEDKSDRNLNRNDRPYGAWLYLGLALQSETDTRLDTMELDVGAVGPYAFGEQIQNNWHRLIGSKRTEGWRHQVKSELGVNLVAERKWRNLLEFPIGDLGVDAIPSVSASLGNVQTYGGVGVTFRVGENLQTDFGPPRIRPALPGSAAFRPEDPFAWYLFAGTEGRYVARDIFLDGNTFRDGPSVDRKPLVADLQAGLALIFQRVRVSYTQVLRTREFDGQKRPDLFGSLSLSARF